MTSLIKVIFWTPRLLSIGFLLFLSLFTLDVFSEYSGFTLVFAFFIHLVPSLALGLVIFLAWRYELIGAVAFLGFGLLYVLDVGLSRPISWYLAIVLPTFLVGTLYLLSWYKSSRSK